MEHKNLDKNENKNVAICNFEIQKQKTKNKMEISSPPLKKMENSMRKFWIISDDKKTSSMFCLVTPKYDM